MVNAIDDKVGNYAYVSIAIFTVNLLVFFLSTNEKSLNIKKNIALEAQNFFCSRLKFL